MFDIEYKGANGVIISTKKDQLVVDPKLSVVGLKDLPVKDAVEVATEERFALAGAGAKIAIEGPGDYEVSDFSIKGIAATRHIDTDKDEKKATIYHVEVADVVIAILGNIAPNLSDEQLEGLGVVDILIVPVGGGGYTLDATSAAALTRQIDTKVVIPVHYADNAVSYEVPQDVVDTFTKELGAPVETTSKYRVKGPQALPQVLTTVLVTRTA